MNHPNVPLATIALELGTTADELARRFGDAVVVDDGTGLRCVPAERCREAVNAHRSALQAERDGEIARREGAQRQPHPTRDHVRAVQASQRPFSGSDGPALERLMADAHADRPQLYPQGGAMVYHKINEEG
jgi:hypothetical protein